jgi:hypothetical protein
VAALFGFEALAQVSSVTTGTVVDAATKQPIADVVVTATAPGLMGEQVVVTDATGQYRIPQLPPSTYTLRFEKEAYKPYQRGGITLRAGTTIRVNVELLPEGLTETMEVVAAPPTVDVGSASAGVSVDADVLRNVAVIRPGGKGSATRSFESLAELAPGANEDRYGVSISGSSSPDLLAVIPERIHGVFPQLM